MKAEDFIRACCVCKKIYDADLDEWVEETEPDDPLKYTHGYCIACYDDVIKEIDEMIMKANDLKEKNRLRKEKRHISKRNLYHKKFDK